MNDARGVAVLNGVYDLEENLARFNFIELALFLDVLHQFAAAGQLHNHYQLLTLHECVVQLNDVLVAQFLDAIRLLVNRVDFVRIRNYIWTIRITDTCELEVTR